MKKQGSGIRDRRSESIETLLRGAIPRVDSDPEPARDLWLAMQARLNAQPALAAKLRAVPWFDWALAVGLAVFALTFPAAVPMLLYYL